MGVMGSDFHISQAATIEATRGAMRVRDPAKIVDREENEPENLMRIAEDIAN